MLIMSPLCDLEQIQAQGYAKLDNYFATGASAATVTFPQGRITDLTIPDMSLYHFRVMAKISGGALRLARGALRLGAPRPGPGRTAPGAWAFQFLTRINSSVYPKTRLKLEKPYLGITNSNP
ncbi:hypothetical protein L2E82_15789 [Cichorium intybus]|uniref:Uncharacterized protein n=1 Tax=Cichorium intybus TaxID=13427 RepID=A0ACB9F4Y4_CICIN|nr:hypothetical protein L2E82_15789 [Cichorium intybus]